MATASAAATQVPGEASKASPGEDRSRHTKQVASLVTPELRGWLEGEARQVGLSLSTYVRQVLMQHRAAVEEQRKDRG